VVRHDSEDVGVVFAHRYAARRRPADFDLRVRFVPIPLDDHDVTRAKPIFPF
jgi:hypothetical protein